MLTAPGKIKENVLDNLDKFIVIENHFGNRFPCRDAGENWGSCSSAFNALVCDKIITLVYNANDCGLRWHKTGAVTVRKRPKYSVRALRNGPPDLGHWCVIDRYTEG
jgi:hypothetical protein